MADLPTSLEQWQCTQLNALAFNCCQAGGLAKSPACGKLSRLLLGHHKQLLSPETSFHIISRFLDALQQCQQEAVTCRFQHLEVGVLIAQVLDGLLFSSFVPETQDALEVWSNLVCVIAGLAWQDCTQLPGIADLRRKWESLSAAASKLWGKGVPLQDLQDLIPLQVYNVLENLAGTIIVHKW